jgi:hypothetical protein
VLAGAALGLVVGLAFPGGTDSPLARTPEEEIPVLEGPYLGQKPPGMVPEIFAPGIVSTESGEGCHGFMLDGKLFLFNSMPPGADWKYQQVHMMHMKDDGRWVPLGSGHLHGVYPYNFTVAPDGRTLYLSSIRKPDDQGRVPQDGSGELLRRANIWKITVTDRGWAQPELIPDPISTDGPDAYPTVTRDGTLYFMSVREGGFGEDDIYRSRLEDGRYTRVEHLGQPVNTGHSEVDLFVAPDESYLIFCSDRPGGVGKFDLYITFRKPDGSWTEPVNMGKAINTPGFEFRPAVTPDGKYFFFTRAAGEGGEDALYWVDSRILESFRATRR